MLTELKNRGVADVLMVVCDGLTGLPDAITTVWPRTITQTCIVHYPDVVVIPTAGWKSLPTVGIVLKKSA